MFKNIPIVPMGTMLKRDDMALTEGIIKKLEIKDKRYKKLDFDGLYLFVESSGSKIFRFRYKITKDTTIKIGVHPLFTLEEARDVAHEYRRMIARGLDPKVELAKKKVISFDFVMQEFLEQKKKKISTKTHKDYVALYANHIKPYLGNMELHSIEESNVADVIKNMTLRGIKTAQSDARSLMEWAFDFAYTKHRYTRRNPAQINISIFLPNHEPKPFRHLVKEDEIREMMTAIKAHTASYSNLKIALELMPYVFLRPYNLATAKWEDMDLVKKVWTIPAKEMKMKRDHTVPLTDKVLSLIEKVKYNYDISPYLFRSHVSKSGHISPDTLTVTLRRMNINSTAHGVRHMASTILRENAQKEGFSKDAIEYQLAHVEGGISGVYNHADYLEERIRIMQWWSDYLEKLY